MKRAGGLFERVLAYENLRLAFWRASRGKRERDETRAYRQRLDAELVRLRDGLADGSYPVGNYRTFVVYEPKERLICAAPFCERVLHHALMNVCAPLFERWLVADTFACRPGLGQTAALVRGEMLVRRYDWYLKCDIRKYFYSISHDVVAAILRRKFKDRRIVFWFLKILSTYEASPGRGLPIGNLTSQYLANLYLDPLDRARGVGDAVRLRALHGRFRVLERFEGDAARDPAATAGLSARHAAAGAEVRARAEPHGDGDGLLGTAPDEGRHPGVAARAAPLSGAGACAGGVASKRTSGRGRACGVGDLHDRVSAAGGHGGVAAFTLGDGNGGMAAGTSRVQRGGSWNNDAGNCRAARRNDNAPANRNNDIGFRLALPARPAVLSSGPQARRQSISVFGFRLLKFPHLRIVGSRNEEPRRLGVSSHDGERSEALSLPRTGRLQLFREKCPFPLARPRGIWYTMSSFATQRATARRGAEVDP